MNKCVLRKAVSMTAVFSFLYMAFSGIVMYFTPQGRIAYWADWRFMGMNKTMYNQTHITVSILFIIVMILHIWLNWKPIVAYMKNSKGSLIVFTKETVMGLVLSFVVIAGTLMMTPPFSSIIEALDNYKEDYEYTLGNPPYPHAELTTLIAFIKRMKFDEEKSFAILKNNGIKYTMDETLKTIAQNNNTDPAYIYNILKPAQIKGTENEPVKMYDGVQQGVDMSKYETLMGSGMGKKSLRDVASSVGISVEEAQARLKKYNIEASPEKNLRSIGQDAGVMPMDVYIIIDSGVKPE